MVLSQEFISKSHLELGLESKSISELGLVIASQSGTLLVSLERFLVVD